MTKRGLYEWTPVAQRIDMCNELALESAFLPDVAHFALKFSRERDRLGAIQKYIRENVEWIDEPGERLCSADITLRHGLGDCDDSAIAMCALALALGHDARVVAIEMASKTMHAVCQILENGKWEFFDCSVPDILPRESPLDYERRVLSAGETSPRAMVRRSS